MRNVKGLVKEANLSKKMTFEQVEAVFDALNFAFHPDGIDDGEIDTHCYSLWILFLSTAGWSEDEFWDTCEKDDKNHTCNQCQEEQNDKLNNN